MSMEHVNESYRDADREAAIALLKENKLLSSDSFAREVVETGVANGKPIDVGQFLSIRLAALEKSKAESKLRAAEMNNPELYMVVNSVAPEVEKYVN